MANIWSLGAAFEGRQYRWPAKKLIADLLWPKNYFAYGFSLGGGEILPTIVYFLHDHLIFFLFVIRYQTRLSTKFTPSAAVFLYYNCTYLEPYCITLPAS